MDVRRSLRIFNVEQQRATENRTSVIVRDGKNRVYDELEVWTIENRTGVNTASLFQFFSLGDITKAEFLTDFDSTKMGSLLVFRKAFQ